MTGPTWPAPSTASLLSSSIRTRHLPDEDDVDAAGQLVVDLQDLPDLAVLPVGGLRAGVFRA